MNKIYTEITTKEKLKDVAKGEHEIKNRNI